MSGKSAFRSLDINCGDTDVVGSGGQLAACRDKEFLVLLEVRFRARNIKWGGKRRVFFFSFLSRSVAYHGQGGAGAPILCGRDSPPKVIHGGIELSEGDRLGKGRENGIRGRKSASSSS